MAPTWREAALATSAKAMTPAMAVTRERRTAVTRFVIEGPWFCDRRSGMASGSAPAVFGLPRIVCHYSSRGWPRSRGAGRPRLPPVSDHTFTHLDPLGRARMVDVTPKDPTHRRATARCKVFMKPETTVAVANREVTKGDVLAVARVAGIQAAKRTADTIPLCHPLLVGSVMVNFEIGDDYIAVESSVETVDRTGVEMEALHACAVAALTIYDMCKSVDRAMVIGELCLWEKTGGRSGTYRRKADA